MLTTLNTNTLGQEPWVRWFLYGDTGSGKTSAAATFPRPLFLVPKSENSVTTLGGRNFPFFQIVDRSSPLKGGIGGLEKILSAIETDYEKDPGNFPFDTIVFDAMTHYAELVLDELTEGNKVPMDRQKYERLAAHFRNIHARLSEMQIHVVYCALAKWDEKTDKGSAYLSGKSGDIIPSACEVYAHMTVKDQGKGNPQLFTMHTQTHQGWKARTRLNRLPAEITNFHFDKVRSLLSNTPVSIVNAINSVSEEEK